MQVRVPRHNGTGYIGKSSYGLSLSGQPQRISVSVMDGTPTLQRSYSRTDSKSNSFVDKEKEVYEVVTAIDSVDDVVDDHVIRKAEDVATHVGERSLFLI
jgi:hypothetical protein